MPATEPDQHVTTARAAELFGVSPKTIRRLIASGDLPAVKIGCRGAGTVRDTRALRIPLAGLAQIAEPLR